jgi:hypothetical protein
MKKLILLGAVLAGTAHAQQTFYTDQYGQPQMTAIQVGNQTFFTDRYGAPIGTAIQQPQQAYDGGSYAPDSRSQYVPNSVYQEQQYERYQQQRSRYGN